MKVAIITGANGGIGIEITRSVAMAGYQVVMVCRNPDGCTEKKEQLIKETGNSDIFLEAVDFALLPSVCACAESIIAKYGQIDLLMNNAGTISNSFEQTEEGLEKTVCVNYIGPYLFTRKLLPYIATGGRIVNMVSCTYPMGKLVFPDFFTHGKQGTFFRLLVYSNTKLALLLFTQELAKRVKEKGISVNAADPGIVSTPMISMQQWFDPLADIFFRPFIRKPETGASTAVDLLLKKEYAGKTGLLCANNKIKKLSGRYLNHPQQKELWERSEEWVKGFLKDVARPEEVNK